MLYCLQPIDLSCNEFWGTAVYSKNDGNKGCIIHECLSYFQNGMATIWPLMAPKITDPPLYNNFRTFKTKKNTKIFKKIFGN